MSYRIAQDFNYVGNDYWRWRAWVDGSDAELDNVKEVVWILHPSFPRPRVTIKDRATGFRLETAGWGTFVLRAELVLSNGEKRLLRHALKLEYADTEAPSSNEEAAAATKSSRQPTVFLSYSGQDARAASKLRESLTRAGVDVFDQTRIKVGVPWNEAVQRMIAETDGVIGLVGTDDVSPFVVNELGAAVASLRPAAALIAEGNSGKGLPPDIAKLHIDLTNPNVSQIVEFLRGRA